MKARRLQRSKKTKTILMIYSINQPCSIFPLAEAVGEMSLPLSLEIVGTDRSLGDNEGAVRELGVVGG